MTAIPPTNTDTLTRNHNDAKSSLWKTVIVLWGLMLLSAVINDRISRLAIAAAGLALCQSAKPTIETLKRNRRTLQDVGDIHATAFQQRLFEYLTSKEASVDVAPAELPKVEPTVELYNWADAVEEAVGFLVTGNSGSGKSSVAAWLAGLLTANTSDHDKPAEVFAIDPHFNDIWGQRGLTAISDIAQIERIAEAALSELDARQKRQQEGLPIGHPIIIIADEIGSMLYRFQDAGLIKMFLQRMGSEGRKFDMTLIALNQSPNVEDLGISSKYRSNYFQILLCAGARAQAATWKDGDHQKEWVKGRAYPCVVSGSVLDQVALHPTHHEYTQFRKKGNPPRNMLPINQLESYFLKAVQQQFSSSSGQSTPKSLNSPQSSDFNGLSSEFSDFSPPADGEIWQVDDFELTISICEAIEDPTLPKSTTAFVEWFWGIKRGGNKAFRDATTRVNELMEIEGLTWQ